MVNPDQKISRPARAARLSSKAGLVFPCQDARSCLAVRTFGPPCPSLHQGNSEIKVPWVHCNQQWPVVSISPFLPLTHWQAAELCWPVLSTFRYHHRRRDRAPDGVSRVPRRITSRDDRKTRNRSFFSAQARCACHVQTRRCIVSARGPRINECYRCRQVFTHISP
jgi:hypothetical protein